MISKVTLAACAATIAIVSNTAAAKTQAEYDLDLSEQPLGRSLREVASKTGTNIVFVNSVVRGKTAPSLRGRFTAGGAYRTLLEGSGLILRETAGGSYVVTRPGSGATPMGGERPAVTGSGSISGRVAQSDGNRIISGALVRIEETGQVATAGFVALLNLAAIISVSIGLLNLFPIPMLDGGHLLFYAIEAIRGRPLSETTQEIGFRIGLAFVLMLMLFATWNDLIHLKFL